MNKSRFATFYFGHSQLHTNRILTVQRQTPMLVIHRKETSVAYGPESTIGPQHFAMVGTAALVGGSHLSTPWAALVSAFGLGVIATTIVFFAWRRTRTRRNNRGN